MDRSPLRTVGHWRTWTSAGAVLFLCWFLLANRGALALLPHGIATQRVVSAR